MQFKNSFNTFSAEFIYCATCTDGYVIYHLIYISKERSNAFSAQWMSIVKRTCALSAANVLSRRVLIVLRTFLFLPEAAV